MNILFIYVFLSLICYMRSSEIFSLNENKGLVRFKSKNAEPDKPRYENFVSKDIEGTNLTTSTVYCIREKSGRYLGWSGKTDDSQRLYGLNLKSDVNCSNDDAYLFELEKHGRFIRIKNRGTKKYISFYAGNFCLAGNKLLDIDIKLVVQPDDGWLNMCNRNETICISLKNVIKDNVYMNYGTRNFWEIGYWQFIPNSGDEQPNPENSSGVDDVSLFAKIHSFEYETPSDNIIQNKTIRLNLLSTTLSNNSSRITVTHEISNEQLIKNSYQWVFDENFENFSQIWIDRDLPPIVIKKSGFNSMDVNYDSDASQTINYLRHKIYCYGSVYSFKRSITLPPNSAINVNAYIEKAVDLEIAFKAEAEIKAKKLAAHISGKEIIPIIGSSHILSVDHDSVIIGISGKLVSTFGLNSYFNLVDA